MNKTKQNKEKTAKVKNNNSKKNTEHEENNNNNKKLMHAETCEIRLVSNLRFPPKNQTKPNKTKKKQQQQIKIKNEKG